jgi:uncharacterized repeat protein (TIGR01451 family)
MMNTHRNPSAEPFFGRPLLIALSAALGLLAAGSWLAAGPEPVAHAGLVKPAPVGPTTQPGRPKVSARPPAQPGLSISITDGRTSAARGDHLRYVVTVRNAGATAARNLRITLTLPPYLSVRPAIRATAAEAGKVTWRTSLRPGHTASYAAAAVLGQTPRGMGHLAVVACAEQHSGTPVVCAAHLDRLPGTARSTSGTSETASAPSGSPAARGGPIRYLLSGLAVLTCLLLATLAARRIKGRKQPGHAR